jgi:hypothetical protein
MRRKWTLLSVAVMVAATVSLPLAWVTWPGCFSYCNYQRIQNGMNRQQVTELLGSAGEETTSIPGYPPYVHLPGAPPGWTGVVWGDTFVRWYSDGVEIYVGFSEGCVTSKCYLATSL